MFNTVHIQAGGEGEGNGEGETSKMTCPYFPSTETAKLRFKEILNLLAVFHARIL